MTATAQPFWETWGTTPSERALTLPCDSYLPDADGVYIRAIGIDAPPSWAFRWLCQLRAAPYSYDWLDNAGRHSPRELIPGLENLERGQRLLIIELVDFEKDRHLTGITTDLRVKALYGEIAGSYFIMPKSDESCRLIVKLRVILPKNAWGAIMGRVLPIGDFIMMRKQMLNLKHLAETSYVRSATPPKTGQTVN